MARRAVAEALGTAFLLATVIGSGVRGERLASGDFCIVLPANSLATGAMLVALIYLYSQVVLLLLATAYAGSGLIVKIYNLLKHKNESILSSETLVPHPDDTK